MRSIVGWCCRYTGAANGDAYTVYKVAMEGSLPKGAVNETFSLTNEVGSLFPVG